MFNVDFRKNLDRFPSDFGNMKARAAAVLKSYEVRFRTPSDDVEVTDARLNNLFREEQEMKAVETAMQTLADAVNRYAPEEVAEAMFVGLTRQHRTLQAQVMKSIFKMFEAYQDAPYDLRNWSAVVAAATVDEMAKAEGVGFPLI